MMTFLLSAGAMIIVLLLIICIPLLTFRKKDTGAEELPQANIAIYRDQFKELEDELARGAISQNEYDESRLELERRVIDRRIAAPDASLILISISLPACRLNLHLILR